MDPSDMYIGGESPAGFTSLNIVHIARTFKTEIDRMDFLSKIDRILERFKAKGMQWEYFIQDSLSQQWKINGIYPPPSGSDEEKEWVRCNRSIDHDRAHLPSL